MSIPNPPFLYTHTERERVGIEHFLWFSFESIRRIPHPKTWEKDENNNILYSMCFWLSLYIFYFILFFPWNIEKECVFLPLIHHAGFFQYGGSLAGSLYHYARWITHKHSRHCVCRVGRGRRDSNWITVEQSNWKGWH